VDTEGEYGSSKRRFLRVDKRVELHGRVPCVSELCRGRRRCSCLYTTPQCQRLDDSLLCAWSDTVYPRPTVSDNDSINDDDHFTRNCQWYVIVYLHVSYPVRSGYCFSQCLSVYQSLCPRKSWKAAAELL